MLSEAFRANSIIDHAAVLISKNELDFPDTLKVPVEVGQVVDQYPPPGEPMVIKESVNLWIYHPDSINHKP